MTAHPQQLAFYVENEETALLRRLVAAQGRVIEELQKRLRSADPFASRNRNIRTKRLLRKCRGLHMVPSMRSEVNSLYHDYCKAVGAKK